MLDKCPPVRQHELPYPPLPDMYIPTQQERYSKVAWYTILMCLVIPTGVVQYAYDKQTDDLTVCATAFLQPLVHLFSAIGMKPGFAYIFSAVLYAILFFWLLRRCKWAAKKKLTIVVIVGMLTALAWRLIIFHYYATLAQ